MADCPQLVIWNAVKAGSKFCAESSADDNDYNAGARIVPEQGAATQFSKADLDPGPARFVVDDQAYGCRVVVMTGSGATKAAVHAWVEVDGEKKHECTWTVSGANKDTRATIVLVPA